jgi:hypothetical protein
VVFVMAGARDLYDVAAPDGGVIHPGDPVWTTQYTADVRELFRILGTTGAPIVGVKPTCFGPDTLPGGEPQAPENLDLARVQAVAGVHIDEAAVRAHVMRPGHLRGVTSDRGREGVPARRLHWPPVPVPVFCRFDAQGFVRALAAELTGNVASFSIRLTASDIALYTPVVMAAETLFATRSVSGVAIDSRTTNTGLSAGCSPLSSRSSTASRGMTLLPVKRTATSMAPWDRARSVAGPLGSIGTTLPNRRP